MKKRFLLLSLLFAMAFFIAAPAAQAAKQFQVYATVTDTFEQVDGEKHPAAIRWWYSSKAKAYHLFLPSSSKTLYLWFEGADSVTVNGKTMNHGDEAAFLLSGETFTLNAGKKAYDIKVMRSANVPAMFMTTQSGSMDYIHRRKENQETGTLYMVDGSGSTLYDGKLAQIKGRGNATFVLNKKPYQIKLDKGTDLCGMGKAKTWILLADYRDNSLLRNKVAFDLARSVGLAYTSLSQTVDVYLNNDYMGAYLLCEKVETGETRINITDLEKETEAVNDLELDAYKRFGSSKYKSATQKGFDIPNDPEDITGGYLLELDYKMRYSNEPSGFVTQKGQAVVLKEPEAASKKQVEYISTFFQGFENAIRSESGIDPVSGKHYSEFVDMDSLVKKYLLEEIVKNRDANRSSLYFYKPADSDSQVAFMGPAWDYDATQGNHAAREGDKVVLPEHFIVNRDSGESFYVFPALYKHADFQKAIIAAYHEAFVPALNVLLGHEQDQTGTLKSLQEYANEIMDCAAMNFVRWPVFNSESRLVKTGANYQENIDYLVTFFERRMAYLHGQWPGP